jgi:hypothetical protein
VAVPLFDVQAFGVVETEVVLSAAGCVIVTVPVDEQPTLSRTVTV